MRKCISGMQMNIEVFCKLILSFWVFIDRHAQSTQNKKFAYLCNISRKTWGMKLIFCLWRNTKVFYRLIASPWVCRVRHAQSNKFAISLQYLKENVEDELDLLPTDKRQRFLEIAIIILSVYGQACPNYSK